MRKAVECNLFSYSVDDGSRDKNIKALVNELNNDTKDDINWVLLRFDQYRKQIYQMQRKLLKFAEKEDSLHLLPQSEQNLFEQLKQIGQVKEAAVTKLAGNMSLVNI